MRKEDRKKIKELLSKLDKLDEIKEELLKAKVKRETFYFLDDIIRYFEKELAENANDMYKNDVCNCDGINEACSSPLCRHQYRYLDKVRDENNVFSDAKTTCSEGEDKCHQNPYKIKK